MIDFADILICSIAGGIIGFLICVGLVIYARHFYKGDENE